MRVTVLLGLLAALITAAASPAGGAMATRCVAAPIHHGRPPSWAAPAFVPSTGGYVPPYAVSGNAAAAAFFFAPTLRAGSPTNPTNKILWVVRFPRDNQPLTIFGRYAANPAVTARSSWPADASPGEIYPSYVNLPKAGCWELTLNWNSHQARIDVEVHPRTH